MTSERLPAPFRFWMTGSVAVVMAALCYARMPDTDAEERPGRSLRHSAFGVGETVQRIELAARHRGLTVLARRDGADSVLVLASRAGVTPVVMSGPDSPPDVPFAVHVRAGENGHAVVFVGADASGPWAEMPDDVASDLAALPGLLDGALSKA